MARAERAGSTRRRLPPLGSLGRVPRTIPRRGLLRSPEFPPRSLSNLQGPPQAETRGPASRAGRRPHGRRQHRHPLRGGRIRSGRLPSDRRPRCDRRRQPGGNRQPGQGSQPVPRTGPGDHPAAVRPRHRWPAAVGLVGRRGLAKALRSDAGAMDRLPNLGRRQRGWHPRLQGMGREDHAAGASGRGLDRGHAREPLGTEDHPENNSRPCWAFAHNWT